MHEQFRRAKFAVVVKAHRMTVSARVMDDENIAVLNFGQAAINSEFITVFAKGSRYVIYVIGRCLFFSQ